MDPMTPQSTDSLLPVLMLMTSLVPGVIIFFLREEQVRLRTGLNLAGALAKVGLVVALIPLVLGGESPEWRMPLLPGVDLVLRAEPFSLLFVSLSAVLWLLTTIYAIGYLEGRPHRSRFFGFFSLCVASTVGIALAGNLVTFLVFYELLTLATLPLVAHNGTRAAISGSRVYLAYTLTGGVVLLLGVAWLTWLAGPVEFTDGGAPEMADLAATSPAAATGVFVLLIAGMAVKAALLPVHGWLPRAMVAPAPVSALLHAVAVVKAGVFGITRVIHYTYGVDVAQSLGVLTPLAALAAATIVYGSVRALTQRDLKKRLAYSTVSQVAYITLGVSIVGVVSTTGGMVHLVHQGLMKITLFFCAGLFAETLRLHRVDELSGVGRRMPLTATAFSLAAFGMIGFPPVAGFVSKWELGLGGLDGAAAWVIPVLLTSSLLNAAYFLPVVYAMWFKPAADAEWVKRPRPRLEAKPSLVLPAVATALLALLAGLLAGLPYSPLGLAREIAERSYGSL